MVAKHCGNEGKIAAAGKMAKRKEWSEKVGTHAMVGAIVSKNG